MFPHTYIADHMQHGHMHALLYSPSQPKGNVQSQEEGTL